MKKFITVLCLLGAVAFAADTVVTQRAKEAVDDADKDARVLRAVSVVLLNEVNNIRTNAALGLAPRTLGQMRTAIRNELDAQP